MFTRQKLSIASLMLVTFSALVTADSVYVTAFNLATGNQQFGTVDLGTGAFQEIRNAAGQDFRGLVPASNGSLLTLGFDGNLASINPVTGMPTVIGPTGLSDCSTPSSPCGPRSVSTFGALGGTLYATDYSQNLYRVNPATGAATLVGPTGIPAFPFPSHFTSNSDGTENVFTATLFPADGNLYATFDTNTVDPTSGDITPAILNNLYRIDPNTAVATLVAPTIQAISAVTRVNGTDYAFNVGTQQLLTLNLASGGTSFVANVSPGPMYVGGATPTPEPFSLALAGIGICTIAACRLRRRSRKPDSEVQSNARVSSN
ncbi:MAG TPA: hypothetical protein VFB14_02290 [Bryobacteraceae bacterium]|jgi:hypothetical protein|nr:hypothetical protein [Bryobacteraceae bacterium]